MARTEMGRRILLFGGTTEGRELTRFRLPLVYAVATAYGAELVRGAENTEVTVGRMDAAEMEKFIKDSDIACVIDATHPYAREARENIRAACAAANTPLMRVQRREAVTDGDVVRVKSAEEAARFLEGTTGNVLLTTGSKELEAFACVSERSRLFARVLPDPEVIKKCAECGFDSGHIIAMQGPFSLLMNEEMIRLTGARWLVTKDGGAAGGIEEKIEAARSCKARVIMIERPHEEGGHSCTEALLWARRILGLSRPPLFPMLTDMEGRSAVIAGGGRIAARRAATLIKCGAAVTVVSPEFDPEFKEMKCRLVRKGWEPDDLEGAALAVAATDDEKVNAAIGAAAKERGIPVSVADNAAECSLFFPSLVTSGEVSASVSAGALSPALTHRLAEGLRSVWDEWGKEERAAREEKKAG
ncbi:MAG: precorrin-6A reductase, partial [Cloacibacillus porcorum]|uniref:precorrin-6A reductase n=1 Tax=Cloacibacillus porcorum TaxID=1197717 RepID=UPI0023EFDEB3